MHKQDAIKRQQQKIKSLRKRTFGQGAMAAGSFALAGVAAFYNVYLVAVVMGVMGGIAASESRSDYKQAKIEQVVLDSIESADLSRGHVSRGSRGHILRGSRGPARAAQADLKTAFDRSHDMESGHVHSASAQEKTARPVTDYKNS